MFKSNIQFTLVALLLFCLFPAMGQATVSDFEYINSLIAPYRSGFDTKNSASAEEDKVFQSFAQIKSIFGVDSSYQTHCFSEFKPTGDLQTILTSIPTSAMDRLVEFRLEEKQFGFDVFVSLDVAFEHPLFFDESSMLECSILNSSCAQISASSGPHSLSIKSTEIEKEEKWVFYLTPEGELFADASYTLSKRKETWLGGNKGTTAVTKNYVCYLERIDNVPDQPPQQLYNAPK